MPCRLWLSPFTGPRAARVTEVVAEVRRLREENSNLRASLKRMEMDRSLEAQAEMERAATDAYETAKAGSAPAGARSSLRPGLHVPSPPPHRPFVRQELRVVRRERDLLQQRAAALEQELESERSKGHRVTKRQDKELQELRDELARTREALRDFRLKNKDLQTELEIVQRRVSSRIVGSTSGGGGGRAGGTTSTGRQGAASAPRSVSARPAPVSARAPSSSTAARGRGAGAYGASHYQPPGPSRTAGRSVSAQSDRGRGAGVTPGRSSARFDPTAWVRQQQDRQKSALNRRTFTPPSSRPASGASTPTREQSPARKGAGFGFGGGGSSRGAAAAAAGAEPRALPRYMQGTAAGRNRSREASPAVGRLPSAGPRPAWGGGSGSLQSPSARAAGRTRDVSAGARERPAPAHRSDSPSRAMAEVRQRLAAFQNKAPAESPAAAPRPADLRGSADLESTLVAAGTRPAASAELMEGATAGLADVDARLQRLQSFLREVKEGTAATTEGAV